MRKYLFAIIASAAIISCTTVQDQFQIEAAFEGIEGKWLFLEDQVDREYIVIDSAFTEAGSPVRLQGSVDRVQTMYLSVEDSRNSVTLLMENADYDISGSLENPVIRTRSKAQNDLSAYNDEVKQYSDKQTELRTALQEASESEDAEKVDKLQKAYYAVYDQKDHADSLFVAENPGSFASVIALRGIFYRLDEDQLEAVLASMHDPLHQMEEYSYMYGKMERMKAVAVGRPYTDFGLETPEGDFLKISDIHNGNVLMIDFWASWCRPCRIANPELVEIYQEYHAEGLEILSVSFDQDSASWVKAIADDNLSWNHISDLAYWNSKGAEIYAVPAIPHTVLIDKKGVIRAKKIHGDELKATIAQLINE